MTFAVSSIAVAVLLAIAWALAWNFLPLSPLTKGALAVMSLLPPSIYAFVLADNLNLPSEHKSYAGQLFSVTVLVSIVLLVILGPLIPEFI